MLGSDSCLSQAGLCGLQKLLLTHPVSHSSFWEPGMFWQQDLKALLPNCVGMAATLLGFFIPFWPPSQKREITKPRQVLGVKLHLHHSCNATNQGRIQLGPFDAFP